jgi:hypothetical protein
MMRAALLPSLLWAASAAAWQDAAPPKPTPPPTAPPVSTSVSRAASLRNENVQANRIDNDALKLSNVRLGSNITAVPQPPVEASHFAAEHGRPAGESSVLRPATVASGWHADFFEYLRNSVFNARTFFQVGEVEPSRQNQYGGRFGGQLHRVGYLTGSFQQQKSRGMVNGNVLVPLPSERTPLATDPAVRAVVQRFLDAYPDQAPNRPDFDPRALNTNSPQRIDSLDGMLRLDRAMGAHNRLFLSHAISRQTIHAFQLVAGQNPDTEIHSHRSRLTWVRQFSGNSEASFGAGFTRVMSDLRPEPNAVGPRVRTGYQVEELGPDSQFPIHRAQNAFRYGAVVSQRPSGDRHTLTWGGDITRTQLNGIETNNSRGVYWFASNFGRGAIENMRLGIPTLYEVTLGEMARGFRNWGGNLFFADQWKLTPRLQIYWGLRYNFEAVPHEVDGLNTVPYNCDCNNFSPRFSIAWRGPREWILRTGYTVSFGQILPVTYQQVRYNPPNARYLQVQNPDLLDPLHGLDLSDPNLRTSPTWFSPDLVSPYAHQYSLTLERRFAGNYTARFGYVGSRTFKLLDNFTVNRATPVEGIPLTTATVDARRADPRYYDVKWIVNGGAAYLDAAQATLEGAWRRGLVWSATYTFGKAIDNGMDYSGTAANNDISKGRAQTQRISFEDKKGLSLFDSTHALLMSYAYDVTLPGPRYLASGWQVSGSTLFKTGTPFTLYVGSDGPGFGNVDGGPSDRPNVVDPTVLGMTVGHPDIAPLILRRERFSFIRPGDDRGNLGRNSLRKGGIANFNAAVTKTWKWSGGRAEHSVQLRGEVFNLGNTPQFDEAQRNLSSPAFGKITNTLNDGRVFQFGLRLML